MSVLISYAYGVHVARRDASVIREEKGVLPILFLLSSSTRMILLNRQEKEGRRESERKRRPEKRDDNLCPLPLLPVILSSSSMNQLQQIPHPAPAERSEWLFGARALSKRELIFLMNPGFFFFLRFVPLCLSV